MSSKLWAMARLATPMAVRVAATLRLADHVAAGRDRAADLAAAAGADADAVERLMRYLSVRGLFDRDDTGRYTLTPLGAALRDDHPSRLRPRLDVEGSLGRAELSFAQLLHSIRTGEASFHLQFGRTFFEDWAADPDRAEDFNKLTSDMESRSPDIVAGYDWESLGSVVDVGGGNGALMLALLRKFPSLRATVLEMPDNSEPARKAIAEAGLGDRCDVVSRSFFEPLPAGAGGYVMSFVLHNWGDEPARALLRRCAEAAGEDGVVLVVEQTGPHGAATHTGMDLRMLVVTGGKERTAEEMGELAADVGLRIAAVHPAGAFSIVEMRAAR
ncbi:methyltransferase [Saccharothrix obliqua]|uniref:methyltransferase n=1 Tax=Saccharothrix obliqua TaxID=2861747 RepID=UPI001C5DCC13|nr:methyltransferase [Saccharothrix obliqua]MBW4721831.1 methyltransferase [Saccharothrix obliqua]